MHIKELLSNLITDANKKIDKLENTADIKFDKFASVVNSLKGLK